MQVFELPWGPSHERRRRWPSHYREIKLRDSLPWLREPRGKVYLAGCLGQVAGVEREASGVEAKADGLKAKVWAAVLGFVNHSHRGG